MSTTSELTSALSPEVLAGRASRLTRPKSACLNGTTRGMEALILAGGKGLRLRPFTTLIPKPLVPIGEHYSVLEVVMRQLAGQGFSRAVVTIGHLGQLVQAYAGDGSQWGIEITYLAEDSPLGTMGPVLRALDMLPPHFVVMNADVLTSLDYSNLLKVHMLSGAPLTIATQRRSHRVEFGVLDVKEQRVAAFSEKPVLTYDVNMGIYAVSREALRRYQPGLPYGFDELICDLIDRDENPATYYFDGYWLDIGRPDDYDRANNEFEILKKDLLPNV